MNLDQPLFEGIRVDKLPRDCEIVFVSDLFADDYVGGAELTLQALVDACPRKHCRIRASELTIDHVRAGVDKYWVFGNYTTLDPRLIQHVAAALRYAIVECDYKFCRYRSPEKHAHEEGAPCACHESQHGELIASFMSAADSLWWMSAAQRDEYHRRFGFLADYKQRVLSSAFDERFFARLEELRSLPKEGPWLIQRSDSWIKGTDAAVLRARELGVEHELVGGIPYDRMLERLARAPGVIMAPQGADTCPRLAIEAKLLGCRLDTNANVQHRDEPWFATDDLAAIEGYLRGAPALFWSHVERDRERAWTLSGYATTLNCVSQEYPFESSVETMLGFCDEAVVVDGGSSDGTLERLRELQRRHPVDADEDMAVAGDDELNFLSRLRVYSEPRDWTDPRSGLFDGEQKASARRKCVGDFVWQQDVDEVVRPSDYGKIRELVKNFPKSVPMLGLPIVDFWGDKRKVRIDVCPWKWRISRNSPRITHGVPARFRAKGVDGKDVVLRGTDGCDPVDAITGEPIVFLGFLTQEADAERRAALAGDPAALERYQGWFQRVVDNVPTVLHLSWVDIERKIRLYATNRGTYGWTRHWNSLYGDNTDDTPENNMFFDMKWSDVTDDDIRARAVELAESTGGHVFHTKYRGQRTPWIELRNV